MTAAALDPAAVAAVAVAVAVAAVAAVAAPELAPGEEDCCPTRVTIRHLHIR